METKLKKRFYVIGADDDLTSYSEVKEGAEHFTSENLAMSRAAKLAESEPGKVFFVCATIRFASCDVSPAKLKAI